MIPRLRSPRGLAILAACPRPKKARRPTLAPEPRPSTLSPAVRRLVRQFDLDITGIHGTGPSGRIRVGDVMGLLGGRTDTGNRDAPRRPRSDDACRDAADAGEATSPAARRTDGRAESSAAPAGAAEQSPRRRRSSIAT